MLKMQVIGHLGKDCIVNDVNGKTVINFSVAHSEKYKDNQGTLHEKTTWVDCAWWTDRTAIAQYLRKGTQVWAEGQPEARSFARNDGSPGSSLSLRVREVQLLGGNSENRGTGNSNASGSTANSKNVPNAADITEPIDDLPF